VLISYLYIISPHTRTLKPLGFLVTKILDGDLYFFTDKGQEFLILSSHTIPDHSRPERTIVAMLYTYDINDDVILYCHLIICDPIVFEEKKDEKWRITIDEETTSIEKNDT